MKSEKEKEIEAIKSLLKKKLKLDQIAAELGIKHRRVRYLLQEVENVGKGRKSGLSEETENRVLKLLSFGYSEKEISEGEGIKIASVRFVRVNRFVNTKQAQHGSN